MSAAQARRVAVALAGGLASMASWLELCGISVGTRGDLAGERRSAAKRVS
ncbi:hypothetical protein [Mycobacterium shinjukuense]|uniref:Uncharacterized protein n=1 Tax=Mycobacterium shinjukuense TaxID=398694 RepID=A0A7I7MQI7_9MYCO|nr:hypothetical protein [Mycobacterium shinjukuense]BBX74210.1 hypothetical protein MSHI_21160 [Mycobacterium shinjukuense]